MKSIATRSRAQASRNSSTITPAASGARYPFTYGCTQSDVRFPFRAVLRDEVFGRLITVSAPTKQAREALNINWLQIKNTATKQLNFSSVAECKAAS